MTDIIVVAAGALMLLWGIQIAVWWHDHVRRRFDDHVVTVLDIIREPYPPDAAADDLDVLEAWLRHPVSRRYR